MILQITKIDGTVHQVDAPANEPGAYSDLDLMQAWIRNQKLTNAHFMSTNLEEAKFENCEMYWAQFNHANLTNTTFMNCNLQGAVFDNAVLTNTKFINCNLANDNLGGWTYMLETNTDTVIFDNCDLSGLMTRSV